MELGWNSSDTMISNHLWAFYQSFMYLDSKLASFGPLAAMERPLRACACSPSSSIPIGLATQCAYRRRRQWTRVGVAHRNDKHFPPRPLMRVSALSASVLLYFSLFSGPSLGADLPSAGVAERVAMQGQSKQARTTELLSRKVSLNSEICFNLSGRDVDVVTGGLQGLQARTCNG